MTTIAPVETPAKEGQTSEEQFAAAPMLDPASLEGGLKAKEEMTPMMIPPSEEAEDGIEAGITAWQNNKKVGLLWSNKHPRNGYAHITGVGWQRINNANDSSHLAMAMMTAHAEQTQSTVNAKIDSSGKITEVYVW